ncbi:MAG: C40 family peptidase [Tannerella sp.]|nr:C40 family peptidase [Tannerella sp.]
MKQTVDSIRRQYSPDSRDEVFEVRILNVDGKPVATGFTTLPEAKAALMGCLCVEDPDVGDSITLLPAQALGDMTYGVVNISVADLRVSADYAAEMATQQLLGAPVQLQQEAGWLRVRTAEGYLAWMERSAVVRMTKEAFNQWTAAPKVIFTSEYGFAFEAADDNSQHISDLVFGNMLKLEGESGGWYRATYPDGRNAFVKKSQSALFDEWLKSIQLTGDNIIGKARTLNGIPYTWGGTSTKAMDCSGFVKTVMLMHGLILRRDASQQAKTGIPIDISQGYDSLQAGDLLFFGKAAQEGRSERVRHVAIYMGDQRFIHAAGYVHISSLNPEAPDYDAHNTSELIRATRIIGAVNTLGIWELWNNPLYKEQK